MSHYYETLVLASPRATAEELEALEGNFKKLVAETNGTMKSFEQWGKYKLAYPIRKNDYGIYMLVRYEAAAPLRPFFKKADALLQVKHNTLVMRHVHVALTPEEFAKDFEKPDPADVGASESRGERLFSRDRRGGRDGDRERRGGRDERPEQGAQTEQTETTAEAPAETQEASEE